ncbi:oxygenase MpaB family protein [Pontibacter sp. CAU 1760]
MAYFVAKNSVVREIWGKSDTILFIFAGAAAEFALNKAVGWLYFTGKLPADPLGRLFSTVAYARQIVFSDLEGAHHAIDKITAIHAGVEARRGASIPDWAYRDVLFMLIDYSIRSYELLERKLTDAEKEDVFEVFNRLGKRMQLQGLPASYPAWCDMRQNHLQQNLEPGHFTRDLYQQYRKHLGLVRYGLLLQGQVLVVPPLVNQMLQLGPYSWLTPVLAMYKLSRKVKLDGLLKAVILPPAYHAEIRELDVVPG